jgi:hypothetical protein
MPLVAGDDLDLAGGRHAEGRVRAPECSRSGGSPYRASGPQGPETLAGVHDGVGGVGQHLLDDLATQPGISAALDLDRRRHTVLTYDHVVNRPAIGAAV